MTGKGFRGQGLIITCDYPHRRLIHRHLLRDAERKIALPEHLAGDDLGYRNNTYAIACYKELGNCLISSVEQIGPKQIGRMEYPYYFPIVRWTPSEVVAREDAGAFVAVLFEDRPERPQQALTNEGVGVGHAEAAARIWSASSLLRRASRREGRLWANRLAPFLMPKSVRGKVCISAGPTAPSASACRQSEHRPRKFLH